MEDALANEFEEMEVEDEGNTVLFMEPVLSRILAYLSVPDLLNCRLVCQEWNLRTIDHLGSKDLAVINMSAIESPTDVSSHVSLPPILDRSLESYYSLASHSLKVPFQNYNLGKLPPRWARNPFLQRFFTLCGQHIRSLQVELPHHLEDEIFADVMKNLSQLVPNLQILHVVSVYANVVEDLYRTGQMILNWEFPMLREIIYVQDDEPSGPSAYAWTTLFQKAPLLNTLQLDYRFSDYGDDEVGHNELTALVRAKGVGVGSVKKLRISGVKEPTVSLFSVDFVHLTHIILDRISMHCSVSALQMFLNNQKDSLVILELEKEHLMSKGSSQSFLHNRLPTGQQRLDLDELTSLRCLTIPMLPTKSGLVLRASPASNLRSVKIPSVIADVADLFSLDFCIPSVTNLDVGFRSSYFESQRSFPCDRTVLSLGKMFPSVKQLALSYPSEDNVADVLTSWPNLERLKLNLRATDYPGFEVDFTNLAVIRALFPDIILMTDLKSLAITEHKEDDPKWFAHRLFVHFQQR